MTGILVCLADGDDLTRCQCFIDLALEESKERLQALLVAAQGDWRALAEFGAESGPLVG